jgi:conjugative transfer pilus assembly protein TraH
MSNAALFAKSPLDRMFDALGATSNTSTPGSFQDQAAGYYTGGGFMMRQKNQAFQPLQVSLPQFGAGCRGIDVYLGGMSYMNGRQLVQMMKNMGSQAPTYGFQLALKTLSPQIETLFAQLRKIAMDINAAQMEDCRMVQQLYAAAMPKGSAFEEHACADVNKQHNGEDWFGGKQACKSNAAVKTAVEQVKAESPHLMVGEFNLVWHVVSQMPGIDDEMREFIMTTVGTVVSRTEDERFRLHFIDGKADDKEFLVANLKGGQTSTLHCDEHTKCLSPAHQDVLIAGDKALLHKISEKIWALSDKYIGKTPLSEEELAFLNDAVNVPVYRYIQVSAASGSIFLLNDALEFIAVSVLISRFEKVASEVLTHIESLQRVQMEDSQIEQFKSNLHRIRLHLTTLLGTTNQGAIWRLNQMIKSQEQALMAQQGA